jgi:hypothetical protein
MRSTHLVKEDRVGVQRRQDALAVGGVHVHAHDIIGGEDHLRVVGVEVRFRGSVRPTATCRAVVGGVCLGRRGDDSSISSDSQQAPGPLLSAHLVLS